MLDIEIIVKIILTIIFVAFFMKTYQACEEEIQNVSLNINNTYRVLIDNIKQNNDYIENAKKDFGKFDDPKFNIDLYNAQMQHAKDTFAEPIKVLDGKCKELNHQLFELRKNEWRCLLPILSVISLIWLNISIG